MCIVQALKKMRLTDLLAGSHQRVRPESHCVRQVPIAAVPGRRTRIGLDTMHGTNPVGVRQGHWSSCRLMLVRCPGHAAERLELPCQIWAVFRKTAQEPA